ncbi:MAG: hypothetical protein Ct9H300mP28_03970 [Pseudomonadota bacterium]|nr:MAG: hypothetical protein Ct9H300mP28_03970 [Pseudomonadota bacterium]
MTLTGKMLVVFLDLEGVLIPEIWEVWQRLPGLKNLKNDHPGYC